MLRVEALTKRYGDVTAVHDVTLEVPKGQMVGVIGRSGAGKSTLLRMINRLSEPSAGRVVFDAEHVTGLSGAALRRWRARCAMIFQQFNLVGRLDVLTNVLLGRLNDHGFVSAMTASFTKAERADAIRSLDRLDMTPAALQRADTLSGGQQQRVAIARALMQAPDILLADEPIASLDPRSASIVMDALRRINREDGLTVVCNLHTLDTARTYCDRVVGMLHGRVVFDGSPRALDDATVKRIYGVEAEEALSETVTSTELSAAS
jgi:phosphonate transport system ATP-binding protein